MFVGYYYLVFLFFLGDDLFYFWDFFVVLLVFWGEFVEVGWLIGYEGASGWIEGVFYVWSGFGVDVEVEDFLRHADAFFWGDFTFFGAFVSAFGVFVGFF